MPEERPGILFIKSTCTWFSLGLEFLVCLQHITSVIWLILWSSSNFWCVFFLYKMLIMSYTCWHLFMHAEWIGLELLILNSWLEWDDSMLSTLIKAIYLSFTIIFLSSVAYADYTRHHESLFVSIWDSPFLSLKIMWILTSYSTFALIGLMELPWNLGKG